MNKRKHEDLEAWLVEKMEGTHGDSPPPKPKQENLFHMTVHELLPENRRPSWAGAIHIKSNNYDASERGQRKLKKIANYPLEVRIEERMPEGADGGAARGNPKKFLKLAVNSSHDPIYNPRYVHPTTGQEIDWRTVGSVPVQSAAGVQGTVGPGRPTHIMKYGAVVAAALKDWVNRKPPMPIPPEEPPIPPEEEDA